MQTMTKDVMFHKRCSPHEHQANAHFWTKKIASAKAILPFVFTFSITIND